MNYKILCLSLFSISTLNVQSVQRLPNFVLINLDDCGYGDFSCYGATGYVTPYIDKMAAEGLLTEVRALLDRGLPKNATAMQAIGYKEFLGVLDGTLTEPEALELVKLRSRQYAKRQLTWLRRDQDIHWIEWGKQRDFARALQISTEILAASGLG